MQVRYFAWFDSKQERNDFIKLLNTSRSDIEATNRVLSKYPQLKLQEAAGIVDNFKKEINKV